MCLPVAVIFYSFSLAQFGLALVQDFMLSVEFRVIISPNNIGMMLAEIVLYCLRLFTNCEKDFIKLLKSNRCGHE